MNAALIFLLAGWSGIAQAQDRRAVTEPIVPPVCEKLSATVSERDPRLESTEEERLDTERLQAALSKCGEGKALQLAAEGRNNAFVTGPFDIPRGVTLLIDSGVTLYASRDPKQYQLKPGSCGIVSNEGNGCRPLISVHDAPHAAIEGDGVIDGRGGSRLLGQRVTWWDLAAQARAGGRQQVPRLIAVDNSDDFTLYRITLRNSPNFHVVYHGGTGFTAWGLKIDTPRTARNTDGIDPSSASDITVTHSFIRTGDDNIAIKGSGNGIQHMSVIENHFYSGHGMSIGSETFGGVSDVLVRDLTLDGTDSGIRIKSNDSRGGLVERITYDNICIRNSKAPIAIDTQYNNPGPRQDLIPEYRHLALRGVSISGGGKITVEGQDSKHKTEISFDHVLLDDARRYKIAATHVSATYGQGSVDFLLSGDDVSNNGHEAQGFAVPCNAQFVPFPALR